MPEHFEIMDKLKHIEITQGFSYFFELALNECCPHLKIPDHAEITDLFENLHISLDQCKKTIS